MAERLERLGRQGADLDRYAGSVSTRPVDGRYEPHANWIETESKYDRDLRGGRFGRQRPDIIARENHGDAPAVQIGRKLRVMLRAALGPAVADHHVLAFDKTHFLETATESVDGQL